ncbi:23S rRNA pseudouridine(955/2504/2580) synthase RluC [Neisseriaceae bacterium TC5R-5]|nr:23S rRNA pseudouridine(955/2504/2580) synthase RluC [Neisseriaceae bacterium TC5R-5]
MTDIRKNSVTLLQIDEADAGQRIDNYLVRLLKGVPKSHIYRILRSGEVRVNKGRIDASYRIQAADELRIPPIRLAERADKQVTPGTFPIVYEDNALLVIDKPSGVAVHGGSGIAFGVIEQLRQAHPEWRYLELAHRLDRDTSGLLILAKKRSALLKLHDMLRDNVPDKRYLALAVGQWPEHVTQVKLPLFKYHTEDGERRVQVADQGKYSHTNFAIKQRFAEFTLLEAQLRTGRTHQIRVHMQAKGCAIAGDDKYGHIADNKALAKHGLHRLFLHAYSLSLPHPLSGETLQLQAPLPNELNSFLQSLERYE